MPYTETKCFTILVIHVEYPYRAARRSRGIVRARAWYGVDLGGYSPKNRFMILRRNLPRAYRASGPRFSIFSWTPGVIFKNKNMEYCVRGRKFARSPLGFSGACTCQKGQPWASRLRASSPLKTSFNVAIPAEAFSYKKLKVSEKAQV